MTAPVNSLIVGLWMGFWPSVFDLSNVTPNAEDLKGMGGELWKGSWFGHRPGKILTILFFTEDNYFILQSFLTSVIIYMVILLMNSLGVTCQDLTVAVCKLWHDYTQSNCLIYRCFADMLFSNICDCR